MRAQLRILQSDRFPLSAVRIFLSLTTDAVMAENSVGEIVVLVKVAENSFRARSC